MTNFSLFDDFCSKCGNLSFDTTVEPERSVHYARINCARCGAFYKWQSKPKSDPVVITKLLQSPNLDDWERKFLKIIAYSTPTRGESIVLNHLAKKVT
ncbi:hypothetical protein [Scytonema sp. PCC 10023]|uniref:hypothetical protein n=1 Tax=Scytonema sp. PCC 10023 TaxID=1680591 RepID=UPI0039C76080